jgi:hypothetical protein
MFGLHYQTRDMALSPAGSRRPIARETYAAALLAELIDRAQALLTGALGDRREQDALVRALEVLLLDVEEARARGLRARLFCRTDTGRLDPWSIDPNDAIDDLGGELVPPCAPTLLPVP